MTAKRQAGTFQPGFLDFINRPNPVEPSNINHPHGPPAGTQLQTRTNDDFLRRLEPTRTVNAAGNGRPTVQDYSTTTGLTISVNPVATVLNPESEPAQTHLTLPPPNKHDTLTQQPQVPPVLQGLHQPPPNAGILPSMNAEKTQNTPQPPLQEPRVQAQVSELTSQTSTPGVTTDPLAEKQTRPARRNKWTDAETHALLQGIRRFGAGNWKRILTCPDYSFNHRTATDLKDRFRVVSSNKAMQMQYAIYDAYKKSPPNNSGEAHPATVAAEQSFTSDPTLDLDILPRARRRQRTKWSEEEDEALLRGFGRYGPSWTSIQLDPTLKKRTPTDIRDRIRTRFSDAYTAAGLTPKPAKPRTQMRTRPQPPDETAESNKMATTGDKGGSWQETNGLGLPSLPSLFAE